MARESIACLGKAFLFQNLISTPKKGKKKTGKEKTCPTVENNFKTILAFYSSSRLLCSTCCRANSLVVNTTQRYLSKLITTTHHFTVRNKNITSGIIGKLFSLFFLSPSIHCFFLGILFRGGFFLVFIIHSFFRR